MFRTIITTALLLLLAFTASADDLSASHRQALQEIKKEKKVADAFWYSPHTLWVGMKSDGTSRNGYAKYLCLVLSDFNISKVDVVIKDYRKLMLKNEFVTMGMAYCP
jgi:hypothetical protein